VSTRCGTRRNRTLLRVPWLRYKITSAIFARIGYKFTPFGNSIPLFSTEIFDYWLSFSARQFMYSLSSGKFFDPFYLSFH